MKVLQKYTSEFEINHLDNEYMVSVEGYYDEGDSGIIQGIQFRTNIKTSELIGYNNGNLLVISGMMALLKV